MNLVGYTATALSRNDIEDTPTNKNVVDFAIVELKDLQGNLVVMYDDAEGLNPETQKTCDTDGQVTFFAEVGDYDLEINGKAQRINLAANIADYIKLGTGESVQDFVDSFALKIFQSPTDGGLTEIQTRTVDAGEVYEVRKTSGNSLATIYSDAAGTAEIVQNGTDNKSGSDGVVKFYIADGDYYIVSHGESCNFSVGVARGVVAVDSITDLLSIPDRGRREDFRYLVKGFYSGSYIGGGEFFWDASRDKAEHNGGTIIDPDRIDAWDGTQGDLATLFQVGVVAGSGAFVRQDLSRLTPEMFGAVGGKVVNDYLALSKSFDVCAENRIELHIVNSYGTMSPIPIPDWLKLYGTNKAIEFFGEGNDIAYIGSLPLPLFTHKNSNTIKNISFNGVRFNGNGVADFVPPSSWAGGTTPDMTDCHFNNCAWNFFDAIWDNTRFLRVRISNFYINNSFTSSRVPFKVQGADCYIETGFFGNSAANGNPTTQMELSLKHSWVSDVYLTGYGVKNNLKLTGNCGNLKFVNCIFDISTDAAIYANNVIGPVQFISPKFGHNNSSPTTFYNGIVSLFNCQSISLINPIFMNQFNNGYRYRIEGNCKKIMVIDECFPDKDSGVYTRTDSISVSDPDELIFADSYKMMPANKMVSIVDEPLDGNNDPISIFDQPVYRVAVIDVSYTASTGSSRQMRLGVSNSPDGQIIKIKNNSNIDLNISNGENGIFHTIPSSGSVEIIKISGAFIVR